MATYTIDKIKYSNNTYNLIDSGAIHNSNGILIGTTNNFKSNRTIVAEEGIFNKLIATSANISTLDVDSLTAQNATVVGLLDVQGQLKTNTWTNSNIATIEGNFFIAPTIVSKSTSSTKYQLTIQNQASTNSEISPITGQAKRGWVLTISGKFDLNQVGADLVSGESSTNLNQWSQGSKVLITGDIEKTDGVYPLGTLTGFIYSSTTSSGSTLGSITIYNVTDNLGNTDIFTILGANTYNYREVKVSLTQRYYGGLRPIGILMSAQGRSSKSFIDIYGGANALQSGALSGASSDFGGLAIPNVRIGNLRGLPNVRTDDFTNDNALPTGWGIYTDNGYFKGTIVSNYGEIGGWRIETDKLYSGAHDTYNSEENGIYLGTSTETNTPYCIAGGPNAQWWLKSDGTAKIGDLLLQYNENEEFTLSVPMANITGTLKANLVDADTLEAITGNMGTLNAGRIQGGTSGTEGFMFISPENYGENLIVANSSSKTDWKLILGTNFGVDSTGKLYGTNANLQGVINASEFSVVENGNTYMSANAQGINIGMISGFHLQATNEKLSFYANQNSELAYLSGSHLYIKQVVVLDQMDVGFPFNETTPSNNEVGKGQWSWKVHLNGENPPKNNLYLKWIG